MPRFPQSWYDSYLARNCSPEVRSMSGCEDETPLQREIRQWCKARNIPCGCSRMDKPSTMPVGWPDMTIVLNGRAIFIECKTRTGKRSKEQQVMAMLFEMHGQTIHIVRSFEEFIELTKNQ